MWRCIAYASIGDPARYHGDIERGDTYSVLPVYTTAGYLPCTEIKQGFYSKEDLLDWLINRLLSLCNEYLRDRSLIVLDNVSVHVDPRIVEAIQAKGCLVKYLPSYSPDYTPIELTFSMLNVWMWHYLKAFRHVFQNDFKGFLRHAIEHSGCDRKAVKHFRHSTTSYIFDDEIEDFERHLEQ